MLDKFQTVRASNGGCINKNCLYVNDYHALQTESSKEMPKPPYPGLWLLVMWAQIDEPGSLVRCEDFIGRIYHQRQLNASYDRYY